MKDKMAWVEIDRSTMFAIRIFKSRNAAQTSKTDIVQMEKTIATGQVRYALWLRSKGECEICASPITEESSHMHELKHRGKGGEVSLQNSVLICVPCHKRAHKDRNPKWSKKGDS